MKRFITYIAAAVLATSCLSFEGNGGRQYDGDLHTLTVKAVYPAEYSDYMREGVVVGIENIANGNTYSAATDAAGEAVFRLAKGIYRVMISDAVDGLYFNAIADRFVLQKRDESLDVHLNISHSGVIVIKEIYCGGCPKTPEQGVHSYDQYVVLHNNSLEVQYLDALCFGVLDPYNSNATNVWISPDNDPGEFVPVVQCVWQIGGSGEDFPLLPGEDAVIAVTGAVDNTAMYPLSVNLNREGYFVCYDNAEFPNAKYHPAPGDCYDADHYMHIVLRKLGQSNAYTFSQNSPATVIFRSQGMTMEEYMRQEGSVIDKPGSAVDDVALIPFEWVLDAVEVYNGSTSNNTKRLKSSLDAGYVTLSATGLGHTLHRRLDEEASAAAGFDVYCDTNNSSEDFFERETQSLRE